MPNTEPASTHFRSALAAVILLTAGNIGLAQPVPIGRLDFLKSKDPSIALFANTSAGARQGKTYPDELVLITGLPSNPTISARIDLLGANKPRCPATCGGLRNVVLSPDGDTALVSSDPHDNMISTLFLLRNIKVFARSKDPADLQVRAFIEKDFPQLDNVSGLAFGPDGRWAVVNTAGPSPIDGSYISTKGTVVVITGLPGDPKFSAPFPVPMHSQGNIDLSLDGGTLLLNDTTRFFRRRRGPEIRPDRRPRDSARQFTARFRHVDIHHAGRIPGWPHASQRRKIDSRRKICDRPDPAGEPTGWAKVHRVEPDRYSRPDEKWKARDRTVTDRIRRRFGRTFSGGSFTGRRFRARHECSGQRRSAAADWPEFGQSG